MPLRRFPIDSFATAPDSSGDVFFPLDTVYATNDFWKAVIAAFNDSGNDDELHMRFPTPLGYVDSAKLIIVWTTTATSGDWEAGVAYRAVAEGESLDQATAQESLLSGNNFTAPASANLKKEDEIDLTDGNFAEKDTVQIILSREGADAGDTLAATVRIFELFFECNVT